MEPAHAVECLKSDGLHSVWLIAPPGRARRTLKTWPVTPWLLCKLLLGIAQPQRQLRGMRKLRRLGIRTPQSLSSWRLQWRNGRPVVELELEYAPGKSVWEIVSGNGGGAQTDEARMLRAAHAVGGMVARLAAGGVFHRDLKVSNVVVDATDEQPRLWLIDTVGVRAMRRRTVEIERMLERLAVQPMALPEPLAWRLRAAVLRSALRPLRAEERRAVVRQLRQRIEAGNR